MTFLELVSIFIEEGQNFRYDFLSNKEAKKFKNHQRTYRRYWFNYPSRDTLSLISEAFFAVTEAKNSAPL